MNWRVKPCGQPGESSDAQLRTAPREAQSGERHSPVGRSQFVETVDHPRVQQRGIPKLLLDIENYEGREVTKSAMRIPPPPIGACGFGSIVGS